jgi:hypothetical protein
MKFGLQLTGTIDNGGNKNECRAEKSYVLGYVFQDFMGQ